MNILLAEDDERLGKLVKYMMESEGHKVDWRVNGDKVLRLSGQKHYDLLILDWMLTGLSGIELCRQIRTSQNYIPILMLTARDKVADRVAGLDAGADDYMVKPFEFSELFARIRSLFRRTKAFVADEVLSVYDMALNRANRTLTRDNATVQLSNREFQLLELLADNQGKVLSREFIINRVWGLDSDVTDNNLDAYIRLLRKKIDTPGKPSLISNVWGVGYKF